MEMANVSDQQIEIQDPETKPESVGNNESNLNNENKDNNEKPSEKLFKDATEELSKTWFDKYFCCLNFLKEHFNITSEDFIKRFLYGLIPFNPKFKELKDKSPDLYGPFWIYTALIIVISATGCLVRFIQGASSKNFFSEFVPIAMGIIYIIGFGLPIAITILMKCFGTSVGFVQLICTYGYSWGIYIPASIVCVIQNQYVQWAVLLYAAFSSTSLLIVNYYKEVAQIDKNKKYIIVTLVLLFQSLVFILFKLYFFNKFIDGMHGGDKDKEKEVKELAKLLI